MPWFVWVSGVGGKPYPQIWRENVLNPKGEERPYLMKVFISEEDAAKTLDALALEHPLPEPKED